MSDPRLDPHHSDYAAYRKIPQRRLVLCVAQTAIRKNPHPQAEQTSELIYGERAETFAENNEFFLVRCAHDSYVGFAAKSHFCAHLDAPAKTEPRRINIATTPIFTEPQIKSPIIAMLTHSSLIIAENENREFYAIRYKTEPRNKPALVYILKNHTETIKSHPLSADSLIAQARKTIGLPYIWGGRSFRGMDCSGLIQYILAEHAIPCPRDTDMQSKTIGKSAKTPKKGDILFWPGHTGLFTGDALIHAYGGSGQIEETPISQIFPRLKSATNSDISAIRRIT